MKMPRTLFRRNAGFTLIEVLVSILVLALGLLGLAGLQLTSIKDNVTAYQRSQATQLTYDIIDRIRANSDAVDNYLSTYMKPDVASSKSSCLAASGCTSEQMAENDLYEWNQAMRELLPLGTGSISVNASTYTVTIAWDHNRDDSVSVSDPSFSASFQL